ncbi:corticotropin-releasing factor-binding protein-like [Ctenocephalides felis]|uniref:corticotropin-releasing factor-binding protein-like n=1 Tax=Ctenocephalides felis TaxID=7515 RepID=UPI000E6E12D8|nr:corticotropin-releasing factor-binding protein-like [Ctenocephalides felis]XP_026480458.1 corticotropin-releasing factor-binding protein-like [Ctenocephalides felis]
MARIGTQFQAIFTSILSILFLSQMVTSASIQDWVHDELSQQPSLNLVLPQRPEHILTDCMHVTSEDGDFFFKSNGVEDSSAEVPVCGLYLITEANMRVELTIRHFDVPCEDGGLIAWIDGWELNGEIFPSPSDHPSAMRDRVAEMCGASGPLSSSSSVAAAASSPLQSSLTGAPLTGRHWVGRTLRSSQNAALLQYRVGGRGRGFGVSVRYVPNHSPCNILVEGLAPSYTLRNHGKRGNCTLSAMYPSVVRVLSMQVGDDRGLETGTLHKCQKRGIDDFVEIGGTEGLDSVSLQSMPSICGQDSRPGREQAIFCGVSTVRLQSSGRYNNQITLTLRPAEEQDYSAMSAVVCGV